MSTISQRIKTIQGLIVSQARHYHRNPEAIQLLAVSKGQPISAIQDAYDAGLRHFGENYYQEAYSKINALQKEDLFWHFIGPIQSNKVKGIAKHFSWVQSLCRKDIALLLNQHRSEQAPPLNVCIQINLDNEATKAGLLSEEATTFVDLIKSLPKLQLRGLMAIPSPCINEQKQYESFLRLNQLLLTLNQKHAMHMDTLSMGMSDDFPAAIRAGSTMIRIGRALFGERNPLALIK